MANKRRKYKRNSKGNGQGEAPVVPATSTSVPKDVGVSAPGAAMASNDSSIHPMISL